MRLLRLTDSIVILGMLAVLLCSGCGGGSGESGAESSSKTRNLAPVTAQSAEVSVVNSSNALGNSLMKSTLGNAVVAPFSASLSLAKLKAGAKGETRDAISRFMHLTGLESDVDSVFNKLDLGISSRIEASMLGIQPSQASSGAWVQARYGYLVTYLDVLAENYGLKPLRVDFALDLYTANQTISGQCATTKDTRLVLDDSVRFDAAWADPFDPALTERGGFQPLGLNAVEVPFMRKNAILPQTSGDGYLAFALPLTGGQQFLIVLPDEKHTWDVETGYTAERIIKIANAMTPAQVDLALPKFSIKNKITLDLGVASSKGVADFSGIDGTRDLYLSSSVHYSMLSVTESGLGAFSSTSHALDDLHPETWTSPGSGGYSSASYGLTEQSVINVILGRPFIFAIRDSATDAILLMGRVTNPKQN